MKCILFLILSIQIGLLAQSSDTILVQWDENNSSLVYTSILEPGQTIYSIAQESGYEVSHILQYNGIENVTDLPIGMAIRIPISPQHINLSPSTQSKTLVLNVEAGMTCFSIAKKYLQIDVQHFLDLNHLNTPHLNAGKRVILGYVTTSNTDSDLLASDKVILPQTMQAYTTPLTDNLDSIFFDELLTAPPSLHEKGIAIQLNTDESLSGFLALHPTAPINSEIYLYNPMMKKSVQAKVISKIPRHLYPKDVSVVLSPAVAKALGALDRKFVVEMTYTQ